MLLAYSEEAVSVKNSGYFLVPCTAAEYVAQAEYTGQVVRRSTYSAYPCYSTD
jgi:hypothetical protein